MEDDKKKVVKSLIYLTLGLIAGLILRFEILK